MTKEMRITHYMKNLGISREEAIALIADDDNDISVDLTPEQTKVVSAMTRSDGDKTTRKNGRKPEDDKRHIIRCLDAAMRYNPHVTDFNITNPEREIEFYFKGVRYRLTLSKPRKE